MPVLVAGPDGSIEYRNPAAASWLDAKDETRRAATMTKIADAASGALATGEDGRLEIADPASAVQFAVVPAVDSGVAVLYGIDLTDRVETERRLRSLNFELEQRLWAQTDRLRRETGERRKLVAALTEGEETFRELVAGSLEGILIHRDWQPLFANATLARMFGYEAAEDIMALESVQSLYAPEERDRLAAIYEARMSGGDAPEVYEFEAMRADGSRIWIQTTVRVVSWLGERATQHWFVDVTERKSAEQQLARLASYDVLTGLANRSMFQNELHQSIAQAGRNGQTGAMLLIDLDNFKDINDSLGHPAGDTLLRKISDRLVKRARETDLVARLGGDEFAIIANNLDSANGAAVIAQTVTAALSTPVEIDGTALFTKASIGISLFPQDGTSTDILLKNADMALYQAKSDGGGKYCYFDPDLNRQAQRRKILEHELRSALGEDRLSLKFQPKVDADIGTVVGVEALLRWNHPELGEISPAEFIPVAETSGLIVPVGDWVLRKACEQTIAWQDAGLPPIPVAVNLSAVQFKRTDLVESVGWLVRDLGIDPSWLELEITESMIMENVDSTVEALHGLHGIGVSLAIDDFGTGHSSLAYLKRFPMDKLKIDRSFVNDVVDDPDDAAIAQIIISLAQQLNLDVIAEGVETVPQLEFLRDNGCNVVQGYHFSPPLDAGAFVDWYGAFGKDGAAAKRN